MYEYTDKIKEKWERISSDIASIQKDINEMLDVLEEEIVFDYDRIKKSTNRDKNFEIGGIIQDLNKMQGYAFIARHNLKEVDDIIKKDFFE